MIVFPNAKINLGLQVLRKRPDGFHDIETVFYPVPLYDILEVVLSGSVAGNSRFPSVSSEIQLKTTAVVLKSGRSLSYSASGLTVDGAIEKNLCIRACELYDEKFGLPGDLSIHLHKIIPMGAGLGGGSSDAAFMLQAVNRLSGNKASKDEMLEMSAHLGSDCSFFMFNKPAFATGRGEVLQPVNISLEGYQLVIVKPPVHVSTKNAFEGIHPHQPAVSIQQIVSEPLKSWKGKLLNDFESNMLIQFPEIEKIKKLLINNGAVYASLTGSGSAVYGLFTDYVPSEKLFEGSFYYSTGLDHIF